MTAVLLTPPVLQFFGSDGVTPLASGKVYTYSAGTTTPKATYTTAVGDVAAANPVILDSVGKATMWISGSYKLVVKDSLDNTISTTDSVTAFTALAASSTSYFQSFSGTGAQTAFTTSTDLGTDEKAIYVWVNSALAPCISNGTFATDTIWTKGAGWTIAAGVATATGAISTAISQTAILTLVEGQAYSVTYTITRSAGDIIPSIGGVNGTTRSTSGTYNEVIVAGSSQTIAFTGAAFTGTLDTVVINVASTAGYEIVNPSAYTISGTTLTFATAPATGTNNIYVSSPSTLVGAASSSAAAAAASETAATASALLASQWATLTSGLVAATDYSSKAWSIGGTGVTTTAARGAAKEWATSTGAAVDTSEYSAKEYATGTTVAAGSAKLWATKLATAVNGSDYSAKYNANLAAASASAASTSETNAATSASNASTSETNSATSATTASNAAVSINNKWTYSTTTTMADPGTGIIRFNNATIASATNIAISALTADTANPNLRTWIASWDDSTNTNRGTITITKSGTPATFAIFTVSGALTDNTTWEQLTVTYVTGSGSFSNSDTMFIRFARAGDKGADGAGTGDFSSNTATSVDSEIVVFSSTTGKIGKRFTGSGLVLSTSGVASVTAPTSAGVMIGAGASAPTTVAPGTSGNVLTSNGSTWASTAVAAASSIPGLGYVSGVYYNGFNGNASGTLSCSADTMYYIPVLIQSTQTFDRLSIYVINAGTATLGRLGIYSIASAVPSTLTLDAGAIVPTSSGTAYEATISQSLSAGYYAIGLLFNGTVDIRSVTASQGMLSYLVGSGTLNGSTNNGWTGSQAYGALPASFPAATRVTSSPAIFLRSA